MSIPIRKGDSGHSERVGSNKIKRAQLLMRKNWNDDKTFTLSEELAIQAARSWRSKHKPMNEDEIAAFVFGLRCA